MYKFEFSKKDYDVYKGNKNVYAIPIGDNRGYRILTEAQFSLRRSLFNKELVTFKEVNDLFLNILFQLIRNKGGTINTLEKLVEEVNKALSGK